MKTVIFDLGGVVFDWNPESIMTAFLESIQVLESERSALKMRLKKEVFNHPDWLEADRGLLTEADAAKRFSARTGRTIPEMEQLLALTTASLRPFPETLQLIDDLVKMSIPLYVLSNMPSERGAFLLKSFDFWDKFEGIILSGDVQLLKPDAAIYKHLLSRFGLAPTDCAFLDDSQPNVIAAAELGIHGIHFRNAADCRPQLEAWLSG
ncbi:MAG: HAD family phosphatase [Chloroflexota bacterium]